MSTQITTEQIKELRDSTGISVMQCKKALEEAEGDMEKALMILKKKSSDIAAKKSDREAAAGVVVVKKNGGKGIILTLNCETDFVAQNSDFLALANTLADKALADGIEAMKTASTDLINGVVQKIGENIRLGDVAELSGAVLGSYVHDGKSGVLVSLSGGDLSAQAGETLGKDIAMHIAAMKPEFLKKEDVPEEKKVMATEMFQKEVAESNKPEEIKQKILAGKIDSYFKEQTLLEQPFIKNPDVTIGGLAQKAGNVVINGFIRYSIGK